MPEGPEIYRAARQLHAAVVGQPVELKLIHPALTARSRVLKNAPIRRVYARSKAMLTEFANGDVLFSHNQLYGQWCIHLLGETCLDRKIRLVIATKTHQIVLYSATDLAWLRAGQEHAHPYIAKLGPEVLADGMTPAVLALHLATFPRRNLAAALLDQSVLAGLGNYLRADILFVSRLSPKLRVGDLTKAQLNNLARIIHKLAWRSVRHDGVLLPMHSYKKLADEGHTYKAARFYVLGREGLPCRACNTPIARIDVGGRGVFFCPECQK
ncbi:MAG: endonuclease VIII [Polaromonas sp.]|nr:endonuclease VIII [Polaromonas sp.]